MLSIYYIPGPYTIPYMVPQQPSEVGLLPIVQMRKASPSATQLRKWYSWDLNPGCPTLLVFLLSTRLSCLWLECNYNHGYGCHD